VLDPTCGSGAFLFAALTILEPLYEACINRMRDFVDTAPDNKFKKFRDILADIDKHTNPTYWIYKKIILNNLYGVDIMQEAVEVAKLRLFLKLAAMSEADTKKPNLGLEPLPDIDFNIRCGNTLIGYTTHEQIRKVVEYDVSGQAKLFVGDEMVLIDTMIEELQGVLRRYKANQLANNIAGLHKDKKEIIARLAEIKEQLDWFLARDYGIDASNKKNLAQWKQSHQPFHWFTEFFGIINKGGFDVIIGNPPYVEIKTLEKQYKIRNSEINTGGNLHSSVAALSLKIINTKSYIGFIVPVSIVNTDRMGEIRNRLISNGIIWVSNYAIRPAKLFSGAEQRTSIYLFKKSKNLLGELFSSKYYKWNKEERDFLFSNISLTKTVANTNKIWKKVNSEIFSSILSKIDMTTEQVGKYTIGKENPVFYKNTGINYFITATLIPPDCYINGIKTPSSRETTICFKNKTHRYIFHALFSSSLFFVCYHSASNCRDLNPIDLLRFKFPSSLLNEKNLIELSIELQKSMSDNSWFQLRTQKQTGEVKIQSFTASQSKPIIDEIDKVLAQHYGFTEEELDFIINYDIKYRMGKELD
jgi:hypothetical protein